jgi:hypothetical protein
MARNKRVPRAPKIGKLWRVEAPLARDRTRDYALQTRARMSGKLVWVTVARGDAEDLGDICHGLNQHAVRIFCLDRNPEEELLDDETPILRGSLQ